MKTLWMTLLTACAGLVLAAPARAAVTCRVELDRGVLPARSTQAGWRACSIIKSPQASMATCVSVQIGRSDHACCVAQARPSMAKAANAPAKA